MNGFQENTLTVYGPKKAQSLSKCHNEQQENIYLSTACASVPGFQLGSTVIKKVIRNKRVKRLETHLQIKLEFENTQDV